MKLKLQEMDDAGFARRRGPLLAVTVESLVAAEGFSVPEAEAMAYARTSGLLRQGAATPGHLLRRIVVDGDDAGWVWAALPGTTVPGTAWLCFVEVDEPFRRQGCATAALTALDEELVERGVPRIGLNVFGFNTGAIRFYESLGYRPAAQQRSRALTGSPPTDGVELVEMRDYAERMAALKADYAADRQREDGMSEREAARVAESKVTDMLPEGLRTPGSFVRTVLAEGRAAGWVWAGPPSRPRPGMGWLHNIEIDAPFRSRGYGSKVIAAVHRELSRQGYRSMGLNVHGENLRAQALYQRLGFEVMTQQMSRRLPGL